MIVVFVRHDMRVLKSGRAEVTILAFLSSATPTLPEMPKSGRFCPHRFREKRGKYSLLASVSIYRMSYMMVGARGRETEP